MVCKEEHASICRRPHLCQKKTNTRHTRTAANRNKARRSKTTRVRAIRRLTLCTPARPVSHESPWLDLDVCARLMLRYGRFETRMLIRGLVGGKRYMMGLYGTKCSCNTFLCSGNCRKLQKNLSMLDQHVRRFKCSVRGRLHRIGMYA
jgi:hypothetical protein